MKNKLTDLNNHLFAELERLGDEELDKEELEKEIGRAKAITDVAEQVVSNATLVYKAAVAQHECAGGEFHMAGLLESGEQSA